MYSFHNPNDFLLYAKQVLVFVRKCVKYKDFFYNSVKEHIKIVFS